LTGIDQSFGVYHHNAHGAKQNARIYFDQQFAVGKVSAVRSHFAPPDDQKIILADLSSALHAR
jgi:hypothetical protein